MEDKIKTISRNNPIFYTRIGETKRSENIGLKKSDSENKGLQQLFSEMKKGF